MLNTTLDTLIAVVIVLLLLSLIVQTTQEAIKKLLKLKSRQIELSLLDLFESVLIPTKLMLTDDCLNKLRAASVAPELVEKINSVGQSALEEQQFHDKLSVAVGQTTLELQLGNGQT